MWRGRVWRGHGHGLPPVIRESGGQDMLPAGGQGQEQGDAGGHAPCGVPGHGSLQKKGEPSGEVLPGYSDRFPEGLNGVLEKIM